MTNLKILVESTLILPLEEAWAAKSKLGYTYTPINQWSETGNAINYNYSRRETSGEEIIISEAEASRVKDFLNKSLFQNIIMTIDGIICAVKRKGINTFEFYAATDEQKTAYGLLLPR